MTKSVGDIAWDFGGWWVALENGHGIRDADVSGLGHPKPDRQALLRMYCTWTFRCQSLLPATPLLRREVVPLANWRGERLRGKASETPPCREGLPAQESERAARGGRSVTDV